MELHDGKQTADGGLIDDALVELLSDGIAEHGEASQEAFVVAAGVGLDDEVAALSTEIGGVGTCLDEQSDVAGTVGFAGVAQRQVVDESADAMGQLHVGIHVDMAAESDAQRMRRQSHGVEVQAVEVGRHRAVDLAFLHQCIDGYETVHELVVAMDVGMGLSVLDVGLCRHVVEVPVTVTKMVDCGVGMERGVGREDVSAHAFGRDVGGDGVERVARHEVVEVQTVDVGGDVVAHHVGIYAPLGLHRTTALVEGDVGVIVGTVGFEVAVGTHAVGDAVVALYVARQGGRHEAEVLGTGLEVDVGAEAFHVVEIRHETAGFGSQCRGQRQVEVGEFHAFQVALHAPFHAQWVLRPPLLHGAGKRREEGHQVVARQLGIHRELHVAGIQRVRERQGHVEADDEVAVGSFQLQVGHFDAVVLHAEWTRVEAQLWHVDVVVAQGTVVPVDAADAISGFS